MCDFAWNRADLHGEFDQLKAQINDTVNRVDFNGITPLISAAVITLQTGADAGETTAVAGVGDFRITGGASLAGLVSAVLTGADGTAASAAITAVNTAIGTINTARAGLGAAA